MDFQEITQDDLYDLGFEPIVTASTKSIDYEHKETGVKVWKSMANTAPENRFWKTGYGRDKIQFETLDQLKEYLAEHGA